MHEALTPTEDSSRALGKSLDAHDIGIGGHVGIYTEHHLHSCCSWLCSDERLQPSKLEQGRGKVQSAFFLPRRLVFGAPSHFLPHRENGAIRWVACHLQNCFHLHPFFPSLMSTFWFYHFLLSEESHDYFLTAPSDNIYKYSHVFSLKNGSFDSIFHTS